jgi:hypothetical protein
MMRGMKHRLIMLCGALLVMLSSPLVALAQDADREITEARLEGYPQVVALEGGSTALTWVLLIFLAALALGGLFKDAKRRHLD